MRRFSQWLFVAFGCNRMAVLLHFAPRHMAEKALVETFWYAASDVMLHLGGSRVRPLATLP